MRKNDHRHRSEQYDFRWTAEDTGSQMKFSETSVSPKFFVISAMKTRRTLSCDAASARKIKVAAAYTIFVSGTTK